MSFSVDEYYRSSTKGEKVLILRTIQESIKKEFGLVSSFRTDVKYEYKKRREAGLSNEEVLNYISTMPKATLLAALDYDGIRHRRNIDEIAILHHCHFKKHEGILGYIMEKTAIVYHRDPTRQLYHKNSDWFGRLDVFVKSLAYKRRVTMWDIFNMMYTLDCKISDEISGIDRYTDVPLSEKQKEYRYAVSIDKLRSIPSDLYTLCVFSEVIYLLMHINGIYMSDLLNLHYTHFTRHSDAERYLRPLKDMKPLYL